MLALLLAASVSLPVIIDTDCGSDDVMAISYLLARREIKIEAITIANGLAHVGKGAENILRLLAYAGRGDVPVYVGREKPLAGDAQFPKPWRETADNLPGVQLPAAKARVQKETAAAFLRKRLKDTKHPIAVLAIGPLTNFGEALEKNSAALKTIEDFVIMGGAVRAQGNLGVGGDFKTDNITAEWNFYIDPLAAERVFNSELPIRLVPLDATMRVPITGQFLTEFLALKKTGLGELVSQVLESQKSSIDQGFYQAWDPLAAVALVDKRVLITDGLTVRIKLNKPEQGRSQTSPGLKKNADVAIGARALMFKDLFFEAFTQK